MKETDRLAYSILEAARLAGIGRSTAFNEIRAGRLKARKLGKRTLITVADFDEWLASLPAKPAGGAQ